MDVLNNNLTFNLCFQIANLVILNLSPEWCCYKNSQTFKTKIKVILNHNICDPPLALRAALTHLLLSFHIFTETPQGEENLLIGGLD